MGKGKRLKLQRSVVAPAMPQAPIEMLLEATQIVGDVFGTTANCADAAALLHEIADQLGFALRVRPVALWGSDEKSGNSFVMGPAARRNLSPEELSELEDHLPNGRDTGHLVLTSNDPKMLFDPNLRQLHAYGIVAPSVAMRISDTEDSTKWSMALKGLQIQYILDEENQALIPRFEKAKVGHRNDALRISAALRRGETATSLAPQMRTLS